MVTDAELLKTAGEPMTGELGPIVNQHPGKLDPMPASHSATWSTKAAASRADLSPATSRPIVYRVAVSTAVSCQTGPMPLSLPT